jgi:hypothetical protein
MRSAVRGDIAPFVWHVGNAESDGTLQACPHPSRYVPTADAHACHYEPAGVCASTAALAFRSYGYLWKVCLCNL